MAQSKYSRAGGNNNMNSNYFLPLAGDHDMCSDDENDGTKNVKTSVTTTSKNPTSSMPPVKVLGKCCDFIHEVCKNEKIIDYNIKKMSIGIKIFVKSTASYDLLIKHLIKCKCQFFSHANKNDRLFKTALLGLEAQSADSVKNELINLGLKCKEVQCILKKFNHGTDTIYIVSFENGSVKVADLNKNVSTLFHTVVRWSFHRRPKNMLVQCRNCQMFGHGERWCHVPTKCFKCSETHKSADCKVPDDQAGKCANCNGNHRANDPDCPSRSQFLQIRERIRANSRRNRSHRTEFSQFSYNASSFPPIRSNNVNAASQRLNADNAWAAPLPRSMGNNSNINNNLFTLDEIADLTLDVVNQLQICKSRSEQFSVITKLAVKYLYANHV